MFSSFHLNPQQGIVISGVPFTEPSHVPQIIKLLRQQALFNTLISSCIRLNGKQGKFLFSTYYSTFSVLTFLHHLNSLKTSKI
jgi:hypothetical protein